MSAHTLGLVEGGEEAIDVVKRQKGLACNVHFRPKFALETHGASPAQGKGLHHQHHKDSLLST